MPQKPFAISNMKTLWSILLACFFIAFEPLPVAGSLSAGAPCFTRINGPVSVPAEISGHAMFVKVRVNGHGPFCVLVDTGCSISVVSPELAKAVDAIVPDMDGEEESSIAENGLGNPTDIQRVLLGAVELGSVRFEGVPAVVSDSFDRMSSIAGQRVDGALGFPLFAELFLGLDFPNQRLLLDTRWPADAPDICTSLPVIEHAGVPFVTVQIQGRSVELMIDSGSNRALQLTNELASLFQWKVEPRAGPLVAVFGEIGQEAIGRLAGSMFLGDFQEVEPTSIVSSGPANLGLRSFERFCVIFHQAENKVWLCGAGSKLVLPTAVRSIGLSFYSDSGGFRIAGIIPGSPAAEARLSVGSLVTQIEHLPATKWTRDKIDQWINSHPKVDLVVSDGTDERALTLRSWVLVP